MKVIICEHEERFYKTKRFGYKLKQTWNNVIACRWYWASLSNQNKQVVQFKQVAFHSPMQNTTQHTRAVTFWTGEGDIKSYFYFMILSHIVQCKSHGCQSKNNTRYLNTSFPLRSLKDFVAAWNAFPETPGEEILSPGGHLRLSSSHPFSLFPSLDLEEPVSSSLYLAIASWFLHFLGHIDDEEKKAMLKKYFID